MKDCCGRQAILYLDIAAVVRLIFVVKLLTCLPIPQVTMLIYQTIFRDKYLYQTVLYTIKNTHNYAIHCYYHPQLLHD